MVNIKPGMLLVSTPEISDGIFNKSIIFICDHSNSGSFGVIVNKPISQKIPDAVMKEIPFAKEENISMVIGGPVQQNSIIILHNSNQFSTNSLEISKNIFLGFGTSSENIIKTDDKILLAFGYCGWGSNQLETEISNGSWVVCDSSEDDIFNSKKDKLWNQVMYNMGGKYKSLSTIPKDVLLN